MYMAMFFAAHHQSRHRCTASLPSPPASAKTHGFPWFSQRKHGVLHRFKPRNGRFIWLFWGRNGSLLLAMDGKSQHKEESTKQNGNAIGKNQMVNRKLPQFDCLDLKLSPMSVPNFIEHWRVDFFGVWKLGTPEILPIFPWLRFRTVSPLPLITLGYWLGVFRIRKSTWMRQPGWARGPSSSRKGITNTKKNNIHLSNASNVWLQKKQIEF